MNHRRRPLAAGPAEAACKAARNVARTATRAAAVFTCVIAAATAHQWSGQPVKLVVGYSAGGTTDVVARVLAPQLGQQLGTTVLVENRPGASGVIAANAVAASKPDGSTLLFAASPEIAIAPAIGQPLQYDPQRDFIPITRVCEIPFVLVVNPNVPAHSVAELIQLAKQKPGEMNFASFGNGASNHLVGELFNAQAGTQITHVPFKGSAPAMTEVLAGRVQMTFDTELVVNKLVKSGQLRALAFAGRERSKVLPDIPTMSEAGLPGFVGGSWVGVLAPKGTPADAVADVNKAFAAVMAREDVINTMHAQGLYFCGATTQQDFARFIADDSRKWADVAQRANIKVTQ